MKAKLPAVVFHLLSPGDPGFAKLAARPAVDVEIVDSPRQPAPPPPRLNADQREIARLRRALGLPLPAPYAIRRKGLGTSEGIAGPTSGKNRAGK